MRLQIGLLQVAPHIAVELAVDLQLIRRIIDALEAGRRAQAAIAVIDVIRLAREPDRRPPAMARRDQLHQAASLRSTYWRMPPARKYSSSLEVSMRHRAVKVRLDPSASVTSTSTSWRGSIAPTPEMVKVSVPSSRGCRPSRRRGTAAAARPCRPGSSGGCARSSRRSPRARRADGALGRPVARASRCHIPCRR